MQNNMVEGVLLGLDIGLSRIGVARVHTIAKIPEPLPLIDVKKHDPIKSVVEVIKQTDAELLVIGLPLLKSGDDSEQTIAVRNFVDDLKKFINVPYVFVDEAYSSQDADDYIKRSGLKLVSNDSVAACIILERYLEGNKS